MTVPIIIAAIVTVIVLGVGGVTTAVGPWYCGLRKPAWNPPNWIFGPAWTVILSLAAWSGVLGWTHATTVGLQLRVAILFGVNILLHMLWSSIVL